MWSTFESSSNQHCLVEIPNVKSERLKKVINMQTITVNSQYDVSNNLIDKNFTNLYALA